MREIVYSPAVSFFRRTIIFPFLVDYAVESDLKSNVVLLDLFVSILVLVDVSLEA